MFKTAVITGAGGAIAGHVIEVFSEAGWRLALLEHSAQACQRLREAHPTALIVQADLGSEEDSRAAMRRAEEHLGAVEALLNLAGGFAMSAAQETTRQDLEAQLDINLRTLFNATRAVLPHMLSRGSGFILGVGAGAAVGGGARMAPYAASKAAVVAYLKSLQAELGPRGIGVSIIYPMGAVDTPGNRRSMPKTDPQKWIDPHGLAQSMRHLATRSSRDRIRELMVYPPS